MFESDVGLSVSFTRQCAGIGSPAAGAPPPAGRGRPPAAAAGATPAAGAGGGGGTNTPAGTESADMTIVCGVDIVRIASQFVDVPAASNNASAIMIVSYCVQAQFAASFKSPDPLYFAYCGNAQSGREMPDVLFVAAIVDGVCPFS